MRALIFLAACGGVAGTDELEFVCADEVTCVEPTIGIGGIVWGSNDGEVAPTGGAVRNEGGGLLGISVGDSPVIAVDGDEVVARGTIHVVPLTNLILGGPEGPFFDEDSDGIYRVPARKDVYYTVRPMTGTVRSQGTHYYAVTIDGSDELCTFENVYYCSVSPVTDDFALAVRAGSHVLRFHSYDGGRDFTFRVVGI